MPIVNKVFKQNQATSRPEKGALYLVKDTRGSLNAVFREQGEGPELWMHRTVFLQGDALIYTLPNTTIQKQYRIKNYDMVRSYDVSAVATAGNVAVSRTNDIITLNITVGASPVMDIFLTINGERSRIEIFGHGPKKPTILQPSFASQKAQTFDVYVSQYEASQAGFVFDHLEVEDMMTRDIVQNTTINNMASITASKSQGDFYVRARYMAQGGVAGPWSEPVMVNIIP